MELPTTAPWAKLSPRSEPREWHPLADHAHDVAATLEVLLDRPVLARTLARLAGTPDLSRGVRARLAALAFLHDYGKANHDFQDRRGGHLAEAAFPAVDDNACKAAGLDALDGWSADPSELLTTILSHHGSVIDVRDVFSDAQEQLWTPRSGYEPLTTVRTLVEIARKSWPDAFHDQEPLPDTPPFWHAVLGLLQIADWLGSDAAPDAFPFTQRGDIERREFALRRSAELAAATGLDPDHWRTGAIPAFDAVSPFPPFPIQHAAGEAEGPIVLLEAETGSGKTEAALYRFARLFAAGRVDGVYLALPTRVAATQMFARVKAAVARLFPAADRPVVVLAIPGDCGADGARLRPLPGFEVEWSDDPDEAARRARWAAERPKRFLAATIAVGTVDQALLGAVRVRHAQMRSAMLMRSLLVVDEVHASDAYMTALLANLLHQHVSAGGEAMLLSATLGGEARTDLLLGDLPRSRRPRPSYEEAVRTPYPAISTMRGRAVVTIGHASRDTTRRIRLVPNGAIADPVAVATRAAEAARAGARVLVVRNTVGDAIATRAALQPIAPCLGFAVDGIAAVHHGRFARPDRRTLDQAVEAALGRQSAAPVVVVGTQTLEISLDIDADLLITDLAPVDVLLQRIGRLHRHARPRPDKFAEACCIVLVPDGFDAALAAAARGNPGGPHGLGTVYDELLTLEATRRLIGAGASWTIPADNRCLVEAGTHSGPLRELAAELAAGDPRWDSLALRLAGKGYAMRNAAEMAKLDWDKPVSLCGIDKASEEAVATRLGGRDVELALDPAPLGPFGHPVDRLVVPHRLNPSGAFEAHDVRAAAIGFEFTLGDRAFVYDNLGLRRT